MVQVNSLVQYNHRLSSVRAKRLLAEKLVAMVPIHSDSIPLAPSLPHTFLLFINSYAIKSRLHKKFSFANNIKPFLVQNEVWKTKLFIQEIIGTVHLGRKNIYDNNLK